jgi:chloramphenicol-sensitive protein RarD
MERVRQHRLGIVCATIAFSAWGVLPFYWKALHEVPAVEILAHRILWSFVFIFLVLAIRKRIKPRELLKNTRSRNSLIVTSLLIGLNWLTCVYAVNSDRIVEASMGYYINPLFSVFLGIVILKERLNLVQLSAFVLACIGVLYLTLEYGRFPWIAVLLAGAFGLYGLFKKTSNLESLPSLLIETMFLAPLAIGIILYQALVTKGALFNSSPIIDFLLIFAGVVTTLPLYWFAQGAKRIPLSSVGFLQYIAPTLMLLIGVFLYRETFTVAHAISFGFIWIALTMYSLTLMRTSRSSGRVTKMERDAS